MKYLVSVFLALLLLTGPARGDLTIENKSTASLQIIVSENEVTPAQKKLLEKYDYGAFQSQHPGSQMVAAQPGSTAKVPWNKKKGHGLLWHFVLNGKSTYTPFEVTSPTASFVITAQGEGFRIAPR